MSVSFHHLLGHVVAADAGFHDSAELGQLMAKAGFTKEQAGQAHDLAHKAEGAWAKYLATEENRIGDHNVHIAVTELEMWAQTVKAILRTKLAADVIAHAMGANLHAESHTTTAIAQALRTLGMLRTDEKVQGCFRDDRQLHDVVQRGWALVKKVFKTCSIRLDATSKEGKAAADEVRAHQAKLEAWVNKLETGAQKLATHPHLLGVLGCVPDGIGKPIGGTSFGVTLHERGQGQVPGKDVKPTSGWSIGRQGRNSENLGKGRIEPTFR